MTRFDAATPDERRALFAAGIAAHRERDVGFLTVEAEATNDEETTKRGADGGGTAEAPSETTPEAPDETTVEEPPWIQFTEDTLNLDCTDEDLDRLTDLLEEYPAFTVEQLTSPENAEGTNVRVSALVDDQRIAAFMEDTFLRAYERPEDCRVWVTTL